MSFCFHIGPCGPGCDNFSPPPPVAPVPQYVVTPIVDQGAEVRRLRLALRRILQNVAVDSDAGQVALDALAGTDTP